MAHIVVFEHEDRPIPCNQEWAEGFEKALKDELQPSGLTLYRTVGGELRLRAEGVVGVVTYRGITIEVLPKVFREEVGPEDYNNADLILDLRRRATSALLYMLEAGGNLNVRWTPKDVGLIAEKADFIEVLRYLFASNLYHELSRGPSANYVPREEDLCLVRGRLLLDRLYPWSLHRPFCRYDEYSLDNPLNRVLFYACTELLKVARLEETKKYLRSSMTFFCDGVELLTKVFEGDLKKVHFTRLNERFRPAFNLATLLLGHKALVLTRGTTEVKAFFLDMDRVFEDFVVACVEEVARGKGWEVDRQGRRFGGFLLERLDDPKGEVLRLKPDAVVFDGHRPLFIVEVKWKKTNFFQPAAGIRNDDFYQVVAYLLALLTRARRESLFEHCIHGLLCFPGVGKKEKTHAAFSLRTPPADLTENRKATVIWATQVPVDATQSSSFDEFLTRATEALSFVLQEPIVGAPTFESQRTRWP